MISRHELASERGNAARAYLVERGIPAVQLAQTTLGLIPAAADLRSDLRRQGYTSEELHTSGLFADPRWPGRIVGAWCDRHAHVITLWARTIDPGDEGRYLYLRGGSRAGTLPYRLSDLLAPGTSGAHREITLVEGVIDVHVLHAHGSAAVAALGGTTLTRSQFERLADVGVDRILLALDNDAAGRAALVRAIDEHTGAGRSPGLWIIDPDLYGDAKDPAELVRSGGADAWSAARSAPVCAVTWRALDLTGPITCSNHQLARRAGLNHAESWLATLPTRLSPEQAEALATVSNTLGFDAASVRRAFHDTYGQRDRAADGHPTRTLMR